MTILPELSGSWAIRRSIKDGDEAWGTCVQSRDRLQIAARDCREALDRKHRRIQHAVPTGEMVLLHSYGGVTAALKRPAELQPAAEGRPFLFPEGEGHEL